MHSKFDQIFTIGLIAVISIVAGSLVYSFVRQIQTRPAYVECVKNNASDVHDVETFCEALTGHNNW